MRKLILTGSLALIALTTSYGQVGKSAAEIEKSYGPPLMRDTTAVDVRLYIDKGIMIAVLYDSAPTAQAIYYMKFSGDFSPTEVASFDNQNIPAGASNWVSVPSDKMTTPGLENPVGWMALLNKTVFLVFGCHYNDEGFNMPIRAYATMEGALLAGKLPSDCFSNFGNFARTPKVGL